MNITASTAIPILARYGLVMPPLTDASSCAYHARLLCWRVLAAHEGDCLAFQYSFWRWSDGRYGMEAAG